MITLKYLLTKDIISREAVMLNWNLNNITSPIKILNNKRIVNAKSLIGLLTGNLKYGNIISVIVEDNNDVKKIREYFDEVGREINDT